MKKGSTLIILALLMVLSSLFMDDVFKKIRKRLRKEYEDIFEVDEKSDFPVHERYTREEDIEQMRKGKQKKRMK